MPGSRDAALEAAFAVNTLAMNGGLDHAFEIAGDSFLSAIKGFSAAGRDDIAQLLSAFIAVTSPGGVPDSVANRSIALGALTELSQEEMQQLVDAYDTADDPQGDIENAE